MLVGPDELAVVADQKHSMYNRIGWVEEVFPDVQSGEYVTHWISLNGDEYIMPKFSQVIPFKDAIKGRVGNFITGGDFHLSVGKMVFDQIMGGHSSSIEVRDELKTLPLEQLQTLAQDMFNTFSKA